MEPFLRHFSEAVAALRSARRIVALTGAGVSAASGIPTFRDAGGLWETFPPEQFASLRGLAATALARPERFAEFLCAVLGPIADARPNRSHVALAALEARVPTVVVTQNVDGLHQEAGSRNVLEVHGSFLSVASWRGRRVRPFARQRFRDMIARLQASRRGPFRLARMAWALRPWLGVGPLGPYRPRVVLFGEGLAEPDWTRARDGVRHCDVLLCVGSSLNVFPAALLPDEARSHGAKVIGIGPEVSGRADVWLSGTAEAILPRLVGEVTDDSIPGLE